MMKDSRIIVMSEPHFQVVDAEGWSDLENVLPHIVFKADDNEDDDGKTSQASKAPEAT
jgi:hypothetical protein